MRILLATDAWHPQVNGVVRTWDTSIRMLRQRGHEVFVLEPSLFPSLPAPRYPEIRLGYPRRRTVDRAFREFRPDAIHIATEGPVGLGVRSACRRHRFRFTTSYHSKFPEFLNHLLHLPVSWTYRYMRWFHEASAGVFVSTPAMEAELAGHGFRNMRRWSRGIDLSLFQPHARTWHYPRPIALYAGRVSREKNIEAFLSVDTAGTKVVVGDGPIRESLAAKYPEAVFLGYRSGAALAEVYSNADVFVFPSTTDTFGLVMIEAMACGVPVAAYPVVGPIDIVTQPGVGALRENLSVAITEALRTGDREACVRHARTFSWETCTDQLLAGFVPGR